MTATTDEPLSIIRQLELMRDLQRLANERAQAESAASGRARRRLADLHAERDATTHAADDRYIVRSHRRPNRVRRLARQPSSAMNSTATPPSSSTRTCGECRVDTRQAIASDANEQQERNWETQALYEGHQRTAARENVRDRKATQRDSRRTSSSRERRHRDHEDAPPVARIPTDELDARHRLRRRDAVTRRAVDVALMQPTTGRGCPRGALASTTSDCRDSSKMSSSCCRCLLAWLALACPAAYIRLGEWWSGCRLAWLAIVAVCGFGKQVRPFPRPPAEPHSFKSFKTARRRPPAIAANAAAHSRARREAQLMVAQRDEQIAAVKHKFNATRRKKSLERSRAGQAGRSFPHGSPNCDYRSNKIAAVDKNSTKRSTRHCRRTRRATTSRLRLRRAASETRAHHDRDWKHSPING